MRRFSRLFRLRNLVIVIIILLFLYVLKIKNHHTTEQPKAQSSIKIFAPLTRRKIDWHNYAQIEAEKRRKGPGEQGIASKVILKKTLVDQLYNENGFNGAMSDVIALNRSVADIRHPKCKEKTYLESLPTVSVVVPFHNEHWSTLLRTATSVLNRSPKHLIKEVLLVDDASTKEFLSFKLDEYLLNNLPKARVIRIPTRSGLITARLAGAREATGDVLVFLDSHTEANVNWLPPLLEPIALDYRTVVCPYIDVIDYDNFEYRAQDDGARGAFDWEFFYKRLPLLPKDKENMPEPFESPVMAGGLFAISRAFFWELGGYDPGLDIWGGEQYELSFKIWQCHGRMLDAACSRVGHIYRKFAPFPNPQHGDFVGKNYRRVAEVWMDEYAQFLYKRRPHYLDIDPGDLMERREIRKRLKCRPFKWFLHKVAFDLMGKYPAIEPPPFAEGRIRPIVNPGFCIDMRNGAQNDQLHINKCSNSSDVEQTFVFSWHKDVHSKTRKMCWDVPDTKSFSPILLYNCHYGMGNQLWKYDIETKQIQQGENHDCLDWDPQSKRVFIEDCQDDKKTQKWTIDKLYEEQLKKWSNSYIAITGPTDYDSYDELFRVP